MRRLLLLALVAPATLRAQNACPVRTADSVSATVVASVAAFDTSQHVPPIVSSSLELELASLVRLPQPLAVGTYVSVDTSARRMGTAFLGISGLYSVALRRSGTPSAAWAVAASGSPDFDRALTSALDTAARSGNVFIPDDVSGDSVVLRVAVETIADAWTAGVALASYRTPKVAFDSIKPIRPTFKNPLVYPDHLKRANIEGEVLARFIVDSSGSVFPSSIRYTRATDMGFVLAVHNYLAGVRMTPFRVGGCPVAVVMSQPFAFNLIR